MKIHIDTDKMRKKDYRIVKEVLEKQAKIKFKGGI